ncbi:hypothetical protein C0J52_01199 [Blattella germanica]|nr:hypothetical protein C0J52_01199 [Blattella germanica]
MSANETFFPPLEMHSDNLEVYCETEEDWKGNERQPAEDAAVNTLLGSEEGVGTMSPVTEAEIIVDRRQIQEVQLSDEAKELQTLGLSVYDQDTLEKGILHQVDQALEKLDQQKLEQQMKAIADDIVLKRVQESEIERKIRLGEMTPFGNVLGNKAQSDRNNGLSEFEKYLQSQAELENNRKYGSKKKVKTTKSVDEELTGNSDNERKSNKKSPLKKSILFPKKRKKKEKLGSNTSDEWWDHKKKPGKLLSEETPMDDNPKQIEICSTLVYSSLFVCVESRTYVKVKKASPTKRRRRRHQTSIQDPEDWGTDDSDWEYSDEESKIKRRKSTKKEVDDGNIEDYYERIKLWEDQKAKQPEPENIGCHEIEGGYKIPKDLWTKLYKYKGLGPTLIVCPTTVMHQWVREFHVWWPEFRVAVLHESGSFHGKRQALIREMKCVGCVLVTSYTGAVQHQDDLLAMDWHYVTLAVKQFRTPHRLILTGSPMQNNLKELWSLFDFVFPGKLGTLPVFLAQMAVPITQGGYANASEVATAYRCATVLRDTIAPFLLRRMKADVKSHIRLPPKNEQVLFCRLTEEQRSLYKDYLSSGEVERILQGRFQVFVGLIALRKICNHPDLYSGGPKLLRGEREEDLSEEVRYGYWKRAGKMLVVESLLSIWNKQGHRVLLFTQSRQMLCIMEAFVQKQGYKYMKLDGGTGVASRQPLIAKFNEDKSYFVFLLTTRVGGLGVNLTGADRVVIYDPDWNPATDTQARERAWRIGQQNNVTVYRLVTAGTIEEKVKLSNKKRRMEKPKKIHDRYSHIKKETSNDGNGNNVQFSESKMERMKRLAKLLSKQIGGMNLTAAKSEATKIEEKSKVQSSEIGENSSEHVDSNNIKSDGTCIVDEVELKMEKSEKNELELIDVKESKSDIEKGSSLCNAEHSENSGNQLKDSNSELKEKVHKRNIGNDHRHGRKHRHHNKKHSRRKEKGIVFEGERVPYLVGQSEAKAQKSEDEESAAQQDDYVLRKLFKKSGIQTAMKHDTIMEGGDADYALVEGEAKRVARDAINALKESRRQCWQADAGVPSWTGQSGAIRPPAQPRQKFGKDKPIKLKNTVKPSSSSESCDQPMSSSELLSRMRTRNRLLEPLSQDDSQQEQAQENPAPSTSVPSSSSGSVLDEHMELLTDIRNFVAFGASVDGRATTQEILQRFTDRLPKGSSPLFKFMLSEICEFHRMPSGDGMWKLQSEFRW